MTDFPAVYLALNKGVAGRIQAVMTQQSVQIGPGRFGSGGSTGPGKEFLPGLAVKLTAQLSNGGFHQGIVVKEKVRPLQSYVEHPAKPGNTLPGIRREIGKNQLTEPVVGITGRHSITSTHF